MSISSANAATLNSLPFQRDPCDIWVYMDTSQEMLQG